MSHVGYIDPNYIFYIKDLKVYFTKGGFLSKPLITKALDGINLKIRRKEVLALVGESGSGKTTLGRTLIGLQKPTSGQVIYNRDGNNPILIDPKAKHIKKVRRELQMIYQDPYSSIDPYMKVYNAMEQPLKYAGIKSKEEINKKIEQSLKMVGLPYDLVQNYVFQLSGGQRQRLSIARALSLDPKFLVADEPVTMLDASLKGEIVEVLSKINKETGITILFITHELPIAKIIANRIAVMYKGKIVEAGNAKTVLTDPLHPYTKALLEAYPRIDPTLKDTYKTVNVKEEGKIVSNGCPFYDRCPFATQKCLEQNPQLKEISSDHEVACWLY